jgi:hypothetical protein
MTDPLNTALNAFGAIGTFAQNNPELKAKLNDAVAQQWDAARFQRELWTTNWWKSLSENQKQLQTMQATDPAQYNEQLALKANIIRRTASGMGLNVDANSIAQQALWNNWSDQDVSQIISDQGGQRTVYGQLTGSSGQIENNVRTTFLKYGLQMSDDWYKSRVREVQSGRTTTDGLANEAIGYASKLYPQYTQDFLEGRTLSDIAQPFIQAMGNTLEVDPSSINLNDKTVQKALQGDGKTPMTMYQFQQTLTNDPRWGKTNNAKNAAYDTLAQIGKDWGFVG